MNKKVLLSPKESPLWRGRYDQDTMGTSVMSDVMKM